MITEKIFNKYVEPVYGHLMSHTKVFQQPLEIQLDFKRKIISILEHINEKELTTLLYDDNWRCSLVAAWLIFLKDKAIFTDDIGQLLCQGKAGTIGYCYALAKFGTNDCSEYLIDYLNKELKFDKIPVEKFQDTALYALALIDSKNKTKFSNNFLEQNGLYTEFIQAKYFKDNRLKDSSRWGDFETNYYDFICMFNFMNGITTNQN